ncbi:MAG: fasciclin domain-containing protein [Pseudomonadota bacterium]
MMRAVCAALGFGVLTACGGAPDDAVETDQALVADAAVPKDTSEVEEPQTLRDVLENDDSFSTLVAALDASDLLVTLEEEGPLTIFAPNNAAFDALPAAVSVDVLTAESNKAVLRDLLAYHVLSSAMPSYDIDGRAFTAMAVNGDPLQIDGTGPVISVSGAAIVMQDLEAENGIIHVIDAVLLPPAN